MKPLLIAVFVLLTAASASFAGSFTIEAGWSIPNGSFAEPPPSSVPKGAESSFCFGFKYDRSLVFFDFLTELSYVQFDEKYTGPPAAGEREQYTHTFIPATVGLRKSLFGMLPAHPYVGAGIGLYGYMARGNLLVQEPAGSGQYEKKDFTAVVRPGLNFALGAVVDIPFTFDLAAEIKYHIMVFQGIGDDPADREYPYAINEDSRTFTTLTLGLVF
jgi:hypothetical protein